MSDLTFGAGPGTVSDWAFDQLFRGILSGDISDRMSLTEATLSDHIGVSRTPLRDALQRLELAGIISRQRNRSIRINPPSLEEMERLSMLREVLEGLLVRQAALRFGRGLVDIARLEEIVEQMVAADSMKGVALQLRLGQEFHAEIARLANDPMAKRMLDQVMLSFERYRHLVDGLDQRAPDIAHEHEAVVRALREDTPEAAETLMREHLANARAIYADRLTQAEILNPPPDK